MKRAFYALCFTVTEAFKSGLTENILLEKQNVTLTSANSSSADSVFRLSYGSGTPMYTTLSNLVEGETYQVVIDGTEYTCVAKNVFAGVEGVTGKLLYLGNYSYEDAGEEDTGEPFLVEYSNFTEGANVAQSAWIGYKPGIAASTVTISLKIYQPIEDAPELPAVGTPMTIYWLDNFDKIYSLYGYAVGSNDMLSDPYTATVLRIHRAPITEDDVILPEQELVLTSDNSSSETAPFLFGGDGDSPLVGLLKNLEEGFSYQVVWDGTEYPVVAKDIRSVGADVGDYTGKFLILASVDESEIPFGIVVADIQTIYSGVVQKGQFAEITTYPGIAAESVTVSLKIYRKALTSPALTPAGKISFDTANHPELIDVLPADPTMQDVLDYLLTQKEATT